MKNPVLTKLRDMATLVFMLGNRSFWPQKKDKPVRKDAIQISKNKKTQYFDTSIQVIG